jgi:hypothetical protein
MSVTHIEIKNEVFLSIDGAQICYSIALLCSSMTPIRCIISLCSFIEVYLIFHREARAPKKIMVISLNLFTSNSQYHAEIYY